MTRIARMNETKILRFASCDFIRVIRVIRGCPMRFLFVCLVYLVVLNLHECL